jgi:hypothetical protein
MAFILVYSTLEEKPFPRTGGERRGVRSLLFIF